MIAISLQSGSNGNCIYVEADGVRLLFDAGLSGRQAAMRLDAYGRDIAGADAVLVSHDHSDHTRCAGVFHRKFGLPLYVTRGTLQSALGRMGKLGEVHRFKPGHTLTFNGVRVETVPTPHDGVDGVAFVVESDDRRLGILTDLGHVFDGLPEIIGSLDAVILESNYDDEMLEWGSYPVHLKHRIRGPGGHLSNMEAAELLRDHAGERMQWACLAHLSEANNDSDVALDTHRRVLAGRFPVHLASRYGPSGLLEV